MSGFKPVQRTPFKVKKNFSMYIKNEAVAEKLNNLCRDMNITKNDMVNQMIEHCLNTNTTDEN